MIRHTSDYDDFYIAGKEETERQVAVAAEFIQMVETFCMEQMEAAAVEEVVEMESEV